MMVVRAMFKLCLHQERGRILRQDKRERHPSAWRQFTRQIRGKAFLTDIGALSPNAFCTRVQCQQELKSDWKTRASISESFDFAGIVFRVHEAAFFLARLPKHTGLLSDAQLSVHGLSLPEFFVRCLDDFSKFCTLALISQFFGETKCLLS